VAILAMAIALGDNYIDEWGDKEPNVHYLVYQNARTVVILGILGTLH
jgi:hypothetical protein